MKTSSEMLREFFERFPGVGSRQAARFVYFIFSLTEEEKQKLASLILKTNQEVSRCNRCQRFFQKNNQQASNLCLICSNPNRDQQTLMIVATDADIKPIEEAGYNGVYFVLGGLLALSGRRKSYIKDQQLLQYLKEYKPNEIIFALPATADGDYTLDVVKKLILETYPEYKNKLSILGRGLATGTEIEYADKETLRHALKNKEKLV